MCLDISQKRNAIMYNESTVDFLNGPIKEFRFTLSFRLGIITPVTLEPSLLSRLRLLGGGTGAVRPPAPRPPPSRGAKLRLAERVVMWSFIVVSSDFSVSRNSALSSAVTSSSSSFGPSFDDMSPFVETTRTFEDEEEDDQMTGNASKRLMIWSVSRWTSTHRIKNRSRDIAIRFFVNGDRLLIDSGLHFYLCSMFLRKQTKTKSVLITRNNQEMS